MSILVAIGLPLLVLFVMAESGWANWLVQLLPPAVYAICSLVVFSGALFLIPLAYWLATRPLRLIRALGLKNRWPLLIGAAGLGAIGFFFLSEDGTFQQSRALFVGLLLWGAYIVADAAATLLRLKTAARALVIVVAMILAAWVAWPRTWRIYYTTLNQVATQASGAPDSAAAPGGLPANSSADQAVSAGNVIASEPQYSPEQKAQAAINNATVYYNAGDYRSAVAAYDSALAIYNQLLPTKSESIREGVAVALVGRARSLQKLGSSQWQQDLSLACQYDPSVAVECEGR
jgi:tetratricopeptide (TPR) repeat protein